MENINILNLFLKQYFEINETDSQDVKELKIILLELEQEKKALEQVDITELLQRRRKIERYIDKDGHDAFCVHQRRLQEVKGAMNSLQERIMAEQKMIMAEINNNDGALPSLEKELRRNMGNLER